MIIACYCICDGCKTGDPNNHCEKGNCKWSKNPPPRGYFFA